MKNKENKFILFIISLFVLLAFAFGLAIGIYLAGNSYKTAISDTTESVHNNIAPKTSDTTRKSYYEEIHKYLINNGWSWHDTNLYHCDGYWISSDGQVRVNVIEISH